MTGRRGEAIRAAMQDQLGFTVHDIKPVGLEGSGGSTPLKLTVTDEDGRERTIFAKLYAKSHVRADRWYKLGRTMLYGRLEDETPFSTVRRFVEYEDYTLRMLGDYGFPTPEALGIVEITPEREYLIAMDFFDDAVEIGEAEVDEHVIDEGLAMIRQMWDVGLAASGHQAGEPDGAGRRAEADRRLLRPGAALAVAPGRRPREHDARAGAAVGRARPSTRRRSGTSRPTSSPRRSRRRRGVASPTQLRQQMKQDGRDLLAEFRAMAPARRPIAVQRWSFRRVVLIVASLVAALPRGVDGVGAVLPDAGHRDGAATAAPARRCS